MTEPNLPVLQFKERGKRFFLSVLIRPSEYMLMSCIQLQHQAQCHISQAFVRWTIIEVKKKKKQFVLIEFKSVNEKQTIETWNEKKSSEKEGT